MGETLGESKTLSCGTTTSNMTLGRLKRETTDLPLPFPSEVLDNLFSRRLFNTTMNYIVPCVEVTLPLRTEDGNTVHLAMQAFLGLFSAIAWIATVAIPLVLTEIAPFGLKKRSFSSEQGSTFEYKLINKFSPLFNEKAAKKIGIEWDACLHKTICQAHRTPKQYGIFAVPFVALFAAENSTMNLEQKAAFIGRTSQTDCGIYNCFFDVLDLARYLYLAFWKR
ncbi:hypothetical protein Fcan01_07314 [Folsomia candida]|uniref:Uncharacterized protein n=2 Tax=Folsomia candida TaxID=158441 RepID=A0A226ELN1_FOLCA|nr:hypothetical protein Fcan01_07314 [Folsomia candida]